MVGVISLIIFINYLINSSLLIYPTFSKSNLVRATTLGKAYGKNGVVVSTQKDASEIGLKILKNGGNAVDAAIAVGYALAVSDPCCGNIGGGGFMLIHQADGTEKFINFRESAPLKASADMYLDQENNLIEGLSTQGYLAVGVPGTVKGLNYALEKYGTMSLKQVIDPAINLAKQGYVLQQGDVDIFDRGKKKLSEPNVAKIFLKNGTDTYQPQDLLVQSDLAKTLSLIAQQGTDAFYKGSIAEKVVAASEKNNGILSLEDFANYQISEYEPVSCSYRGYQVTSSPPPGGGTTVCQMLNILSGYDLKQLGWRTPQSLHTIFSSMLLAFGDRNHYLGDPDFVNNPTDKLLSIDYATSLRDKIAFEAIPPESIYTNGLQSEGTSTTHYSVVDRDGNAVAVTYTINSYFGAGVIAPETGFLLNNEMDDFTTKLGEAYQFGLRQGEANLNEPGKRPLSSMSPTIVSKYILVYLVTGSPGGSTIPTTVLQVIINAIDYGMNLNDAVNAPRFHYQGFPKSVRTEAQAITPKTMRGLQLRGYKVTPSRQWGAAESILVAPKTGIKLGINDIRKPAGKAVAY
ncbi:MAG: gamma-glutamyltransferase [Pleurocapsa sp.]